MNFIDKISKEDKEHLKEFLLEVKIFDWLWAVKNVKMSEDFLEEYAEKLDWSNVLEFQDYSPLFEEKFRFKFEKFCGIIPTNIEKEEFRIYIIDGDKIGYRIRNLLFNELKNNFIGIKIIFTGNKGRLLFEKMKNVKSIESNQRIFKIYTEFDESYKKNSVILRVDMVERAFERVFFIGI